MSELHERLMRMPGGTPGVLVAPHGVTAPAQRLLARMRQQGASLYAKTDAEVDALIDARAAASTNGGFGAPAS